MPYSYTTDFGGGTSFVPCGRTFLAEVKDCVDLGLLDVTNLGQIGDARHQAEPTSRHNPAQAPDGNWYVCAADFGGPDYPKLAAFHQALYQAHDPRLYPYGFSQRGDGYGLTWTDGTWHWTGADFGHCHFDFTMSSPSLHGGTGWWVPALASTAPWGLADWLRGGHTVQTGTTTPIEDTTEDELNSVESAALTELLQKTRVLYDRLLPEVPFWKYDDKHRAVAATEDDYKAGVAFVNHPLDAFAGNSIQANIDSNDAKVDALTARIAALETPKS